MSKTFDPTKPVQTREGGKARVICENARNETYPLVALITDIQGVEQVSSHTREGQWLITESGSHALDLINIPERRSEWMNVYKNSAWASYRYATLEAARADASASLALITNTIRFDYEDDNLVGVEIEP